MLNIPILRWGTPYESLEKEELFHFITGEPVAKVSQANTGLLARDMRKVEKARECLREIPAGDLIEMMKKAADFYLDGSLPMAPCRWGMGCRPRMISPGSNRPRQDSRSICARPT